MKLTLFIVSKQIEGSYLTLSQNFVKQIKRYCKFETIFKYSKNVLNATKSKNIILIQDSYYDELKSELSNRSSYNIAFSPDGEILDSLEFAQLIKDRADINFYIGGAYGLSSEVLCSCDKVVSLGRLTMPHNMAYLVVIEQIYRAFCINSNHPYNK